MSRRPYRTETEVRTILERTEATVLARSKLEECLANGRWKGPMAGDFGRKHPGMTWQVEIAEIAEHGLRQARLEVRWKSGGRPRTIVVTKLCERRKS